MKSVKEIMQALKGGNYAPIYFLQGDESYYIDLISSFIEKNALPEEQKGFNQTVVYGNDAAMSDVLNNARRFPMMSDKQVVIVKEAQQIRDLGKDAGQNLLLQYLDNPVPSTILVFCHKNKTLDGRKALAKSLQKKSVFFTSKKLYDNEVPGFVTEYVKARGFGIRPETAMILSESIGNNLERLTNEIEKIMINFRDPVEISGEMVQKFVGISKDYNIFELQNALLKRDRVRSFRIVNYFTANIRQHPVIPIIAMLYAMFSKLLVIHSQQRKQEPVNLSEFGVNGYFLKNYREGAAQYSLEEVVGIIHLLRLADLHCKGVDSAAGEGEELRELVARILT